MIKKNEENFGEKDSSGKYNLIVESNYVGLDEAINIYTKRIKDDPSDSFNYYCRGSTYNLMEEYNLALKDLKKSIELEPDRASAYLKCGEVYKNQKKYDLALKSFYKVIDLNLSLRAEAYHDIASLYLLMNNKEKCFFYLEKAINLDPNLKEYVKSSKHFDLIKDNIRFKELVN